MQFPCTQSKDLRDLVTLRKFPAFISDSAILERYLLLLFEDPLERVWRIDSEQQVICLIDKLIKIC